ncbi:hypothetical protein [Oceanobacillus sp. CF4.6]|uniref:hypothetical protein n=1 Tax=Oceanobacillus sp. CF4.6 TaxID=3373080 RepID=UPI003EE6C518
MNYQTIIFPLAILLLCIAGCGTTTNETVDVNTNQTGTIDQTESEEWITMEGIVIEKKTEPEYQLLVVPNLDKEPFSTKSEEELQSIAMQQDGAYYRIGAEIFNNVEVGTAVVISLDPSKPQLEMAPPIRFPEDIEIKAHSTTSSGSWAYEFVRWNDESYVITDKVVDKSEIGEEIGMVTSHSDKEGAYAGNFSNALEKGKKYYKINGVDTEEAIAIGLNEGMYVKALISEKGKEMNVK